jgi:acyl carrier protein
MLRARMDRYSVGTQVKLVMIKVLDLGLAPDELDEKTSLFSALIALDSLTLLQIITELEVVFSFQIDDEAVMGADLIDVESLITLVESQLSYKLSQHETRPRAQ